MYNVVWKFWTKTNEFNYKTGCTTISTYDESLKF